MEYPSETITFSTKATSPKIPCAGTKRATNPVTPRESILEIPISTIPGTPYPFYTHRDINIFHHTFIVVIISLIYKGHNTVVI